MIIAGYEISGGRIANWLKGWMTELLDSRITGWLRPFNNSSNNGCPLTTKQVDGCIGKLIDELIAESLDGLLIDWLVVVWSGVTVYDPPPPGVGSNGSVAALHYHLWLPRQIAPFTLFFFPLFRINVALPLQLLHCRRL
jgi:hypothetical protein